MIVLDANILIRAVLGRRVRLLLETYAPRGVRFFAPEEAFADARRYLPDLLKKRGLSESWVTETLDYIGTLVELIETESYAALEQEARRRLAGRDEEDWPVLAAALALDCPLWTEDTDFFGTGVAVWNSNRVEIFLDLISRPEDMET